MTGQRSLWATYAATADEHGDRSAVIDQQGDELTHGQLLAAASSVTAGLAGVGLSAGDHVGVFLPNRAAWPVVALAGAKAGIGLLGLNTRFRQAELTHLLGVADVDVVICFDEFLGVDGPALLRGLDRPVRLIIAGEADAEPSGDDLSFAALARSEPGPEAAVPDAPCIGFTTSGTTGFPKVAMHTQAQTAAHLGAVIEAFALDETSVNLAPLPLCGAFGYTAAMATLLAGGTVVAMETWDPDVAATTIAERGVTFCNGSDDMLLALVGSERFKRSTTWTDGGFADFTNAGADAVAAVDEATGGVTRLTGLYGSSEGFALMSSWNRDATLADRSRNGGHVVDPRMRVRVCDPDSGRELPALESGELQFRGPSLITGYLNDRDATGRAFTSDGWYRSGDLGHAVDPDDRGRDGFVYLARLGDSLRLRGFLCDPAEIENHLERHPGVALAQVVGVSAAGTGDRAVAFVQVVAGGDGPSEDALVEHCRAGLANYKRPERIVFVDSFPVTDGPNGVKIRKVELRDRAAALLDER